tara:strand:+ start:673 stop:1035 length:363 start_codon:yes stop_codon:yes gene_type:complete
VIIKNLNQFPIQVNGMADHIHILARLRPTIAPSVFVQKEKSNSSRWINAQGFLEQEFSWQKGGATFSVGERDVAKVVDYIKNQKVHHQKKSFENEYLKLLYENEIEREDEYLPQFHQGLY